MVLVGLPQPIPAPTSAERRRVRFPLEVELPASNTLFRFLSQEIQSCWLRLGRLVFRAWHLAVLQPFRKSRSGRSLLHPQSPPLELAISHPIGNGRVLTIRVLTAAGSIEKMPDTLCSICGRSNQRLNAPSKTGQLTPAKFGRVCTWAKL